MILPSVCPFVFSKVTVVTAPLLSAFLSITSTPYEGRTSLQSSRCLNRDFKSEEDVRGMEEEEESSHCSTVRVVRELISLE